MEEDEVYVMLMMMRADEGYTPNEKCSLEEMVACALADDTDACLAACTGDEEGEEQDSVRRQEQVAHLHPFGLFPVVMQAFPFDSPIFADERLHSVILLSFLLINGQVKFPAFYLDFLVDGAGVGEQRFAGVLLVVDDAADGVGHVAGGGVAAGDFPEANGVGHLVL